MEEYEKKHDHAVAEKETDIPKLTDLLLKVGTQQFLETLSSIHHRWRNPF